METGTRSRAGTHAPTPTHTHTHTYTHPYLYKKQGEKFVVELNGMTEETNLTDLCSSCGNKETVNIYSTERES